MKIERLHGYGGVHTLSVSRIGQGIRLVVADNSGTAVYDQTLPAGAVHAVKFAEN